MFRNYVYVIDSFSNCQYYNSDSIIIVEKLALMSDKFAIRWHSHNQNLIWNNMQGTLLYLKLGWYGAIVFSVIEIESITWTIFYITQKKAFSLWMYSITYAVTRCYTIRIWVKLLRVASLNSPFAMALFKLFQCYSNLQLFNY